MRMTDPRAVLLHALAATLPVIAHAHTEASVPGVADTQAIERSLREAYPGSRFGAVRTTPWPGVFEVMVGERPAYVDASGRYFLFGSLYDLRTQREIGTRPRPQPAASAATIDFASLPLADAIREVRGSARRVLAVFSDPDCAHCRRLDAALADLDDVTIHTFIVPIIGAARGPHARAIAAWCAHDQAGAWHRLMRGDAPPAAPAGGCPNPLERNLALARRLGIAGTPTLVAGDGRVLTGAADARAIQAWLQSPAPVAGAQP